MNASMIILLVLLCAVVIIYFLMNKNVKGMTNISADELLSRLNSSSDLLLIDVREPNEFKSGHIEGAISVPLSQFQQRYAEIPNNRELVIYCQSGMRSKAAGNWLIKHGYTNLYNLRGGIRTWRGRRTN